jgi:Domain of unknown function (DUF6898)
MCPPHPDARVILAERGRNWNMTRQSGREVLIEFQQIGNSVKVTAVDPVTLVEVSIVGAANATPEMLKRLAVRKLDYVLEKQKKGSGARR